MGSSQAWLPVLSYSEMSACAFATKYMLLDKQQAFIYLNPLPHGNSANKVNPDNFPLEREKSGFINNPLMISWE